MLHQYTPGTFKNTIDLELSAKTDIRYVKKKEEEESFPLNTTLLACSKNQTPPVFFLLLLRVNSSRFISRAVGGFVRCILIYEYGTSPTYPTPK